jgi:cell division protein FtsW (lipid II flippase)
MFETFKESLLSWNSKNDGRVKLQHAYIISAAILLLIAGVIGLINRELGQTILTVSIVCASLFLINAVVWSLLQSAVLSRIAVRRLTAPRKK